MTDFAGTLWLVAVVGGPVILALVFLFGIYAARRGRRRTRTIAQDTASQQTRVQRRGTRAIMIGGVIVAAVVFALVLAWPLLPHNGFPVYGNPELLSRMCSDRPQASVQNCSDQPDPRKR